MGRTVTLASVLVHHLIGIELTPAVTAGGIAGVVTTTFTKSRSLKRG